MSSYVEFKNVRKTYKTGEVEINALSDVNFEINKGEFCVIVGASGAGKTTILNILGGMDTLTSGSVFLDGTEISALNKRKLTAYRRYEVGFVFQFYNLVQNLTALENVELMKDIVDVDIDGLSVLDSVSLKNHADQFLSQLSGSEQQGVSIERAVAKRPVRILCDEPLGAFDSKRGVLILNILQNMGNNQNTTFIIATHNAILAEAADKIIRIKNGQIESIQINENSKEYLI